jgi:aromatic ring hydroxylase
MRSGDEYRQALRDGRQVWILTEGRIHDVTTHPLTASMVEVYGGWYDRHRDPSWQDILLTGAANDARRPLALEIPGLQMTCAALAMPSTLSRS